MEKPIAFRQKHWVGGEELEFVSFAPVWLRNDFRQQWNQAEIAMDVAYARAVHSARMGRHQEAEGYRAIGASCQEILASLSAYADY